MNETTKSSNVEVSEKNSNTERVDAKEDSLEAHIAEQKVKVSVIVPIYNACRYLRPAMDSIMNQTLKEIEIICIDDGSTDTSLDMVKIFNKSDNRIRIVTQTNAGPGNARNIGLKRARGEYVAFLDADDFFDLHMLEKMYNHATENDLDITISKYDIFESKKARFRPNVENEHAKIYAGGAITSKNEYPNYILESTSGSAWNKLFKKSFLIEKGIMFLPEVMMFEDVYFTVCALSFAERVGKINEILVHHRIHKHQSRANSFKKYYPHVLTAFSKAKEFLMRGGMYEPLKNGFLNLSCSRCYHIYNLLNSDGKEHFWNMLHDYFSENLGWEDTLAEDFEKSEICQWAANIEMYTYEQYQRRLKRGARLDTERIDQTLKQNKRWRKFRDFFVRIFRKNSKKNK